MNPLNPTFAVFQSILESDYLKERIRYLSNTYVPYMLKLLDYLPDDATDLTEEIIKEFNVPTRLAKGRKDIIPRTKEILNELHELFFINEITCERLKKVEKELGENKYQFGNQARQPLKIIENHDFKEYSLKKSIQELNTLGPSIENAQKMLKIILVR
ncbi:MAG: hypothetical protein MRY57_03135 [Candidatus Pacebacteria bacterium]|nr:hypothetical protein [Candidatus Paceibacterota bacterium]